MDDRELEKRAQSLDPYLMDLLRFEASPHFHGVMEYLEARACLSTPIDHGESQATILSISGMRDLVIGLKADIDLANFVNSQEIAHERASRGLDAE